MTAFPKNPFRPGAGTMPAHMGRRPDTEDTLSGILGRLRARRRNSYMAFVYGPRGNGKTVLLQWLEDEAAKADAPGGGRIVQVRIGRGQMDSAAAVAQTILNASAGPLSGLKVQAGVAVPGIGSLEVVGSKEPKVLSLQEVLSEKADPMLVTLDEAHEAPPAMLGDLLDVVQIAGRRRPIAAVFAGTPGLEAALRAAHASFWSRGRKLRASGCSRTTARARRWRGRSGTPISRPTTGRSRNWPPPPTTTRTSSSSTARRRGTSWRRRAGGRSFRSMSRRRSRRRTGSGRTTTATVWTNSKAPVFCPLARAVAAAFVASAEAPAGRRLSETALDELVARHGDAGEAEAFLVAKGYVWRDGTAGRSWTPGIPSLMDYALKEIPAD